MNIRYSKVFKAPRRLVKWSLAAAYPLFIKIFPLPKVKSIEETIDKVKDDRVSISRFGDGELLYLIDKLNLPFQKYDVRLAAKMKEILVSHDDKILVGLPVGYHSLENLKKSSLLTWKSQIVWIYPRLRKYLDLNKQYYNTNMTRVYASYEDKSHSKGYFDKIMKIWENRDVLLIEGEKSRLGTGNDLFKNVKSLRRIIAPMHHAFSKYDELYAAATKENMDCLILVALGPTATALSYDLAKAGYQSVDIGNVDIEFEWYLRGATSKIKIPGKYTSEAIGGRDVQEIKDSAYESQIIARYV